MATSLGFYDALTRAREINKAVLNSTPDALSKKISKEVYVQVRISSDLVSDAEYVYTKQTDGLYTYLLGGNADDGFHVTGVVVEFRIANVLFQVASVAHGTYVLASGELNSISDIPSSPEIYWYDLGTKHGGKLALKQDSDNIPDGHIEALTWTLGDTLRMMSYGEIAETRLKHNAH